MTIKDYISSKLASLGYRPSEADFLDISVSVSLDTEASSGNIGLAEMALLDFLPMLMARPDISESGFSMRASRGIRDYYSFLCKKHGVNNRFSPKVTFR